MTELQEIITQIDGHTYKYYDSRQGEKVIIFLHGIAANKEVFRFVAENFLKSYRCIILDLPAHHGVPISQYKSINDLGGYVARLIEYLQLYQVTLLGFSLGGIIALETANVLKDSGKIRSVVAWSSPVLGLIDGSTIAALVGLLILKKLPPDITGYFHKNTGLRNVLTAFGLSLTEEEVKAASELKSSDRMKILRMINKWKYEPNEIPKLFIFDPKDPIIDLDNYRTLLGNNNGHDKVVLIPRGGHYGLKSGWDTCVKEIEGFVSNVGAEGGI